MPNTNEPHSELARVPGATSDHAHFDPLYRTVLDAFNHRSIVGSPRAVLSEPERLTLLEPIVARMSAGVLSPEGLFGFVSGVVHGGVPREYFINNPTIPLDLTSLEAVKNGCWLPSYLSERRVEPQQYPSVLDVQHNRIVDAIQGALRDARVDVPVFFMGSAAALQSGSPGDLDIGTSVSLRNQHMKAYDDAFMCLRDRMRDRLIIGNKNHVGAVWSHFHLALGVSVLRYDRALRVTASELHVIERGNGWEPFDKTGEK